MSSFRTLERSRRPISVAMVLSVLALFVMPASMVLCMEADGCITLEATRDGSSCRDRECGQHLGGEQGARDGLSTDGGHCLLCRDIPLRTSDDPVVATDRDTLQACFVPSLLSVTPVLLLASPSLAPPTQRASHPPDDALGGAPVFLTCVRLLI